ncbi:MAG: metallophosphoesterase [Pirellulales bacterium]|nr:metallophosphoesterase [Pirellulales bacterium]
MARLNRRKWLATTSHWVAAPAAFWWSEAAFGQVPAGIPAADSPKATPNPPKAPKKPAADPYADAKFVPGEPPLPTKGAFTIAVLPDTQNYSEKHPKTFHAQTEWILAQREPRNIAAVLHLGDITNRNSRPEWEVAQAAMNKLRGNVPVGMVPGNHDYSKGGGCQDRTTLLNEYFMVKEWSGLPHWGGTYDQESDKWENNYQLFEAAGRKFLILGLEFGPRADVVRWANEVAAKHHDREVILITHAYMYFDETRYDWKKYAKKQAWNPHAYGVAQATNDDVRDGEELWNDLVARHKNFIMTVNGHVLGDGLGQLTSQTPGGRDVPQMLVNFQMKPKGGDGWLRLIEMRDDGTLATYDYSPTRNECNASGQNQFELKLSAIGG